jgi:hypothetical protein
MEHRYSEITIGHRLFWTGKAEFSWLIEAMPLKIWLPIILILIGSLLNETGCITPSVGPEPFTISGCILLLYKRTHSRFYFSSGVSHLDKILSQ